MLYTEWFNKQLTTSFPPLFGFGTCVNVSHRIEYMDSIASEYFDIEFLLIA